MYRTVQIALLLALGLGVSGWAADVSAQAADQKRSLKAAKLFYKEPGMIEVDVRAMRSTLMLTGSVPTEEALAKADELAKEIRGIKEVRNRIRVREPEVDAPSDEVLMEKIQAKIELDEDLVRAKERGRLEVTIEDRHVTVTGKLQDWAVAQTLVNDIRRTPGVLTLNFEKLKY
jgi:osmotically-inducible protein OsmY